MTPNSTMTNASFASSLCGTLALYSGVSITPSSGLSFLLPDCFFENATSLTTISLTRIIIAAESASTSPLVRFQSSPLLSSLSLSSCVFLNHDLTSYESTSSDWQTLFTETTALTFLSAPSCSLNGALPESLPPLLAYLDLSKNNLTGTIPASLFSDYNSSSTSLTILLAQNKLNGTIPSTLWTSGGDFASIKAVTLSLASNLLGGSIPSSLLGLLTSPSNASVSLDLSKNSLGGSVPSGLFSTVGSFWSIQLNLSGNAFTSSLPTSLLSGTNLKTVNTFSLDISSSGLNGTLPTTLLSGWSSLSSLSFNASRNQLTGSLPASLLTPSSNSISSSTIDLSHNRLSGSLPAASFGALNLSKTLSFILGVNDNDLTGGLPDSLFLTYASPYPTSVALNLSNNPLDGSIPSSFFSCLNPASSPSSTPATPNSSSPTALSSYNFTLTVIVSNTSLSGALEIPDLSARSEVQPLYLTIDASAGSFTSLDIHSNSYRYLVSLDVGDNAVMSGTIPKSLFYSNSSLQSLTGPYTGLSGVFPDLGSLQPTQLRRLDLDSTSGLDFCSEPRSSWSSSDISCSLSNTNSYLCSSMYPSSCKITIPPTTPSETTVPPTTVSPSPVINVSPSIAAPLPTPTSAVELPSESPSEESYPLAPSFCSASTQPSAQFKCVDAIWTSSSVVSDSVLTIPSGAAETRINANMTSYRIVFNSIGSFIDVTDYVSGLFHVKILLDQNDLLTIKKRLVQKVVTYSGNSTNLSFVQVTTSVSGSSCRTVRSSTAFSSGTISAVITVDDSRCNVWWKALICAIFGLLIITGVIVGLMYNYAKELETSSSETAN